MVPKRALPKTAEPQIRRADRPFASRKSPGFAEALAETLRERIEAGSLKPGERLPAEHDIASEFGVSRTVVREAIGVLRHDGVVESYQGRGSFVSEAPSATTYRFPHSNLWDVIELGQLIEFLITHEAAAARLAAQNRSADDLAVIRAALHGMEQAVANHQLGADEDFQFHAGISAATHNPFFISFGHFLEQRVRNLIRTARTNSARFAGLTNDVHEEHRAIYETIAAGDADAAGLAAERHLRNAAERLLLYRRRPEADHARHR